MKAKALKKKLETRQKQWDSFPNSVQAATTWTGSQHK